MNKKEWENSVIQFKSLNNKKLKEDYKGSGEN
jgi:hypothetical protein